MDDEVMKKGFAVLALVMVRSFAFHEAVMMARASMAMRSKGFVAA